MLKQHNLCQGAVPVAGAGTLEQHDGLTHRPANMHADYQDHEQALLPKFEIFHGKPREARSRRNLTA